MTALLKANFLLAIPKTITKIEIWEGIMNYPKLFGVWVRSGAARLPIVAALAASGFSVTPTRPCEEFDRPRQLVERWGT